MFDHEGTLKPYNDLAVSAHAFIRDQWTAWFWERHNLSRNIEPFPALKTKNAVV